MVKKPKRKRWRGWINRGYIVIYGRCGDWIDYTKQKKKRKI